jgi:hypothetical protein
MELHPLRILAVAFSLLAALLGVHRIVFAPQERPGLTLHSVHGTLEHQRARGAWRPVTRGFVIRPGDSLRTGRGSGGIFGLLQGDTLELGAETEVVVAELEPTAQEIALRHGLLTARVGQNPRRVIRVSEETTQIQLESIGGVLSLRSDGKGTATATSMEGEVRYSRFGQKRRMRVKEEIRVSRQPLFAGSLPREPARFGVPTSVILKASWPRRSGERPLRGAVVSLRGVNLDSRLPPPRRVEPETPPTPTRKPPGRKGRWDFRFRFR